MFENPVVFIVGAGASSEFGLPLGIGLRDTVAEAVANLNSRNAALWPVLRNQFKDYDTIQLYGKAGRELAATMPTHASIDEALHYWSEVPEAVQLGKIAVANEILKAERKSLLFENRQRGLVEVDAATNAWLAPFLSIALSSSKREQVADAFANVTFIDFNYDRTITHYLYWALQQRCGVSSEIATSAVNRINHIRPYGFVGHLPWQDLKGTPFGGDEEGDLFAIAASIRTYTEQRRGADIERRIDEALRAAQLVVCLGFGFHPQNLSLLSTLNDRRKIKSIIATVFGIREENHAMLGFQLKEALKTNVPPTLLSWKCAEVLSDLRLRIMADAASNASPQSDSLTIGGP
jgi:hypothetical protein